MRILLSIDDGYSEPGLAHIANALSTIAEIVVVAPERDRSGSSNSLTLDRPLKLHKSPNGFYFVNGTPTDCVHLAVTGMLDYLPDMIVSGINDGANMGDDTIYSGTVAAATEGFLFGIPSIAVSLVNQSESNFATAAQVALEMVKRFVERKIHVPILLNINVPDIPMDQLVGMEITRLGRRHKAEPVIKSTNPRGETIYWVGAAGIAQDAGIGTDFFAVKNNKISITPLQIDLTRYDQIGYLKDWLDLSD
ncbi:MAG: 5'/3'-nucleotidase SurE [Nitrosomonas sp.]|nr:5'/3'-nucleotidase SurE [Nitrosomonas sp.]